MTINPEYLSARSLEFLNESNAIESIAGIDYRQPRFQLIDKGHFGAFVDSQECAARREPLDRKKIQKWQGMLTREQLIVGEHIKEEAIGKYRTIQVRIAKHVPPPPDHVPTKIEDWIERVNEALKNVSKFDNDGEFCAFLGDAFQEFEDIHPFADGNGRTGRLIANYINRYCGRPIIIFRSDYSEKRRYYDAHQNNLAMRCHMASKIQEVVQGVNGTLLFKQATGGEKDTSHYADANGNNQESVEWHALTRAMQVWQEQVETKKKARHE